MKEKTGSIKEKDNKDLQKRLKKFKSYPVQDSIEWMENFD
ncbi:hypothetical protein SAMN02745118_01226 [Selenihalanaerobacter shriftii]|uniref:Uncharacterized protein n=1 Tax=Selenihalanaerobacter shriftii TaxID=142842 RepID=A0A1T4LRW9_9FIRM|nr:hypothetical protein SAMN02745118_01226 [Selenihalanaerobacter shriftii]